MTSPSPVETQQEKKVGIGAYIALAFAVVIFSGVFYKMPEAQKWLGAFDFTTLIGKIVSLITNIVTEIQYRM